MHAVAALHATGLSKQVQYTTGTIFSAHSTKLSVPCSSLCAAHLLPGRGLRVCRRQKLAEPDAAVQEELNEVDLVLDQSRLHRGSQVNFLQHAARQQCLWYRFQLPSSFTP